MYVFLPVGVCLPCAHAGRIFSSAFYFKIQSINQSRHDLHDECPVSRNCNFRPLLMLLEKYQKTAFLIINFPTGFFQALVLILTAYQNKKGNKKVVFTGRLQGDVFSLYSIGESVQLYTVCCMF